VLLTSLIGMVAFAIDTGYIALTKTKLQATADAAALAGAVATAAPPGEPQNAAAVRAEVRRYVELNTSGLTVLDEDVRLVRYTPTAEPGDRLSASSSAAQPANAVQVTLRRDALANNPLRLFFAPVIGTNSASLAATATAYIGSAGGVTAGAPLLPYTMHIDYYHAAAGLTGLGQSAITVADAFTVDPTTLRVSPGSDGVMEVVLFGDRQHAPGNFGSLDIGSSQNGTSELERQVYSGPTPGDFANPDFATNVGADGSLQVPFSTTGDTGLSGSVKTALEAIAGKPRIIPLYDTVSGSGNGAVYHLVEFAGVVVTKVDFNGSPKRVWVQPAFVVSNKVSPVTTGKAATGVYTPPKLVIP
jgi:Flp pilus assembly protein TadG